MSILFCDIETYHGFFYVGFKRKSDGKRIGFELSKRSPDLDRERLKKIMLANTIVTFNGLGYDVPLIFYAISGATNAQLKAKSDAIIKGRVRWWDVEKLLGVTIPRRLDHIDLMEPQPNAIASLKTLNGRLHGRRLQDLPFDPDLWPTEAEMDILADYCLTSDLDATENLFDALKEPLELRVALGEEYGQDFRSKSDSQIGEAIVKKRVEQLTGARPQKIETRPGTTFKYPIPHFMKFETPELQAILDRLRETEYVVRDDGKVDLPKWLSETKISLGSSIYSIGNGGLHSTESNRAVHSDDDFALVDADVASMYPVIILMLGLFPKALGKHFLSIYRGIKDGRIDAKKRAKEIKAILKSFAGSARERVMLETELFVCNVKDKGLKIALNGVFGKLGSRYSILYAPHLLLSTTLTGQLTLLMLIERAVRRGIDVVSGNTDGVLFKVPRDWFDGIDRDRLNPCFLSEITDQWEADTGFDLEFAEYRSIYNSSVNSYFAIKADGGHKRKGPLGNPWSKHPDDFDPRAQLMKNPQATICSDAALALIKDGTPIEDTIYGCTDIRQFVTLIKADGGATWGVERTEIVDDWVPYEGGSWIRQAWIDQRLPYDRMATSGPEKPDPVRILIPNSNYLGKVVRYYWAKDGQPIFKSKAHAKTGNRPMVPKSDGAAPCMTLPDELPDDIDYDRYLRETREILMDLGYDRRPPPPPKMVRLTKANRVPILTLWALV